MRLSLSHHCLAWIFQPPARPPHHYLWHFYFYEINNNQLSVPDGNPGLHNFMTRFPTSPLQKSPMYPTYGNVDTTIGFFIKLCLRMSIPTLSSGDPLWYQYGLNFNSILLARIRDFWRDKIPQDQDSVIGESQCIVHLFLACLLFCCRLSSTTFPSAIKCSLALYHEPLWGTERCSSVRAWSLSRISHSGLVQHPSELAISSSCGRLKLPWYCCWGKVWWTYWKINQPMFSFFRRLWPRNAVYCIMQNK